MDGRLLSVVSLHSLEVAAAVQGEAEPRYEEAPHAGGHVGEGCPLSLEFGVPSLIHLSPFLGLARMSTDSCKLLISANGAAERQSESLKRKNGAACV